jgi:hypothetical protein
MSSFFAFFFSRVFARDHLLLRPRNLTRSQAIVTVVISASSRGLRGMLSNMLASIATVAVTTSVYLHVISVPVDACQHKPHWPYELSIFTTFLPCL